MSVTANAGVQHKSGQISARELLRNLSTAAAALLIVAAIFVLWRRLSGAIAAPLPPSGLLLSGASLAGLAWIARLDTRSTGRGAAISAALLAFGLALSFERGNKVGLVGFWTLILGEEIIAWRRFLPPDLFRPRADLSITAEPSTPRSELDEGPVAPSNDVLQQLALRTTAEGGRELSGWLRMPLAAGQRTGSVHVAFCPPFAEIPEVQAEAVSGPECRIKTVQSMPYGARLDVKLTALASTDESVLIWFFAASGPSQPEA